ncbi:hypothetical protein GCM10011371_24560 [Novosphingobium marinum]|uniref:Anti-sigma-K factor RskA n=1 Tax=Novosphingobium marinum TaxID=1514948 RepID=A0A7Y9XXS4_9SPHN|nr:anti-sigma factor [Novosphingobium marinum]NYH96569.1 anti-sigma-K factor RskA [Novosphingobium marinum]GGC36256.1 hypothetical protein GCM10011371_24560 [Novosphingobium marinum]
MAPPDDGSDLPDDPVIRAGEYALGVLEGEELAAAQREAIAGGDFAAAVAWWQQKFAALAEEAGSLVPSTGVWNAIALRLPSRATDEVPTPAHPAEPSGIGGWKLLAALATAAAIAAAVTLFVATPGGPPRPVEPVTREAGPQIIAQLQSEDGESRIASRIDPDTGRLNLSIAGLTPEDEARSAELWVIPEGGAPRSLGLIPGDGEVTRSLSAEEASLLIEGATLAVTHEDRAGAPHEAPTPPILLAGPLSRL